MAKKLIFIAGAGIGYVLGTRAGRQRYDAMASKAREFMERRDFRAATNAVQEEANRLLTEGRQLVRDTVHGIREHADREADRPQQLGPPDNRPA